MFFESHAHYYDEAFDDDREELLKALPSTVKYVVNVGASMKSSRLSVELSNKYSYIYTSVGVHPSEVQNLQSSDLDELKSMCQNNSKVVAIGEIGLDYYYGREFIDIQKYWFQNQIELAEELNLPVIVHSREASQDCFDIIKNSNVKKGVIHCYAGSAEMALKYIDMGFYIGIGGIITFKNARKAVEVVEAIPLNKILIETDCPYLAPVPNRGKRNDSQNLIYIAEKIAQIKEVDVNKVAKVTLQSASELFNI